MTQEAAWLDKAERRFGEFSIPGLSSFLAGMNAVVGVLSLIRPDFPGQLSLEPLLIRQGQLWRLVTFLFIPPQTGPLWLLFYLIMLYGAMRALESHWGEFRFTVFWAAGAAATSAAALFFGGSLSNVPLNMSVFLAFARLFPDFEVMILFVLPVKVRWLALIAWLMTALSVLAGGLGDRVATLAGLSNYLLFFGPGHWQDLRFAWRRWRAGL
ncbi:MAG: hypothetical protein AAB320_08945 [Elusimicrobiota bacterium]